MYVFGDLSVISNIFCFQFCKFTDRIVFIQWCLCRFTTLFWEDWLVVGLFAVDSANSSWFIYLYLFLYFIGVSVGFQIHFKCWCFSVGLAAVVFSVPFILMLIVLFSMAILFLLIFIVMVVYLIVVMVFIKSQPHFNGYSRPFLFVFYIILIALQVWFRWRSCCVFNLMLLVQVCFRLWFCQFSIFLSTDPLPGPQETTITYLQTPGSGIINIFLLHFSLKGKSSTTNFMHEKLFIIQLYYNMMISAQ